MRPKQLKGPKRNGGGDNGTRLKMAFLVPLHADLAKVTNQVSALLSIEKKSLVIYRPVLLCDSEGRNQRQQIDTETRQWGDKPESSVAPYSRSNVFFEVGTGDGEIKCWTCLLNFIQDSVHTTLLQIYYVGRQVVENVNVFWWVPLPAWGAWQLQYWSNGMWNIYDTFNSQEIILDTTWNLVDLFQFIAFFYGT